MPQRPTLLPPALGLLMMLGIFTSHFMLPLVQLFEYPFNYIGLVPITLGAVVNLLAERERFKQGADLRHSSDEPLFVSTGVYQYSRNPSYLGLIFINAGLAIWVGSLTPWLVVLVFPFVLTHLYIKQEEQTLSAHFAERYQAYQAQVPRWFKFHR